MSNYSIDAGTTVSQAALTVASLQRSERFYVDVLGMRVVSRTDGALKLGAGDTPLLELAELPGARPKPARATGLYHFAVLVPSRLALARSLRQLAEMRYPLTGASDHLVSEALYLDDPDGNGIEIYRDRPRAEWPHSKGQLQMAVDPLDIDGILAELEGDNRPWEGLEPNTRMGHIHLHVSDIRKAEEFYHGLLGFDVMVRYGPSALFVAAGGYHHHLGLNTWAGVGAPPAPAGSAGLRWYVVRLPTTAALEQVLARVQAAGLPTEQIEAGILLRDPSQNGVVLTL